MKLLLYDNDAKHLKEICTLINKFPMDILIDKTYNYADVVDLYKSNHFDIIFIDFTDVYGKKILEYILKDNPKQRIITMSDLFECSESLGCDYCKEHYVKDRVLKPITQDDMKNILTNNFTCEKYSDDILIMKLKQIEKTHLNTYSNYNLDVDNKTFVNIHNESYGRDFFHLIEYLDEYKIKYNVLANLNIEIL